MRVNQLLKTLDSGFKRKPLTSNVISATVISWVGDIIAQSVETRDRFDLRRSLRVSLWGAISSGPVFIWLRRLENFVGPKATLISSFKKVAIHQAVASPIFNSLFYGYVCAWEAKENEPVIEKWKTKLRKEFVSTQIAALALWFPANMLAFTYLPLRYRLPFQFALGPVWIGYLSFIGHKKIE